jgi:hypothetical protein
MAAQAAQPAGGGQAEEPDSRRTAGVPLPHFTPVTIELED